MFLEVTGEKLVGGLFALPPSWIGLRIVSKFRFLTPSWWRSLSYKNQSTDMQSKSIDASHVIGTLVMKELILSKFKQIN